MHTLFFDALSKRFGDVMGMKKYYYLYYAGIFFTFSGSVMISPSVTVLDPQELFGYVFFSIGLTLGLIASIKYWGG